MLKVQRPSVAVEVIADTNVVHRSDGHETKLHELNFALLWISKIQTGRVASDRRTGSLVQFRRLGFEAGDLVEGVLVHCAREIKSPASLAPIYNE